MSSVSDLLTAPALPSLAPPSIETISINTIRTLCMDAVQAANSGACLGSLEKDQIAQHPVRYLKMGSTT